MRAYNKLHPGKSLNNVTVRVVRDEINKSTPNAPSATAGKIAFMTSVSSVLGNEVSDINELDAWLSSHDSEPQGFYVLGDTSGPGVLKFEVVEDETTAEELTNESTLNALGSSGSSDARSSSSSTMMTRATEAELEVTRLRAAMEVQNIALEDSKARISLLETAPAATMAPSPAASANMQPPPTPYAK